MRGGEPYGSRRFLLSGENKQVLVNGEVGEAVQHDNDVDVMVLDVVFNAGQVIPGVKKMDLREALRQEGGEGIGVGVPGRISTTAPTTIGPAWGPSMGPTPSLRPWVWSP